MRTTYCVIIAMLATSACVRASSSTNMLNYYQLSLAVQPVDEQADWRQRTKEDTLSGCASLTAGTMLVATTDMVRAALCNRCRSPRTVRMRLIDVASGSTIWSTSLDSPSGPFEILHRDPLIIAFADQVIALHPESGRRLWAQGVERSFFDGDSVIGLTGSERRVKRIGARSGRVHWTKVFPAAISAMVQDGDSLRVHTKEALHEVSLASGRALHRPLLVGDTASVDLGPKGSLVVHSDQAVLYNASGTDVRWRFHESDLTGGVALQDYVLLFRSLGAEREEVIVLSPQGRFRWRVSGAQLTAAPLRFGDQLLLSRRDTVSLHDLRYGDALIRAQKPTEFSGATLSEKLEIEGEGIVVAGETAVAKLSLRTETWDWVMPLRGVEDTLLSRRTRLAQSRRGAWNHILGNKKPGSTVDVREATATARRAHAQARVLGYQATMQRSRALQLSRSGFHTEAGIVTRLAGHTDSLSATQSAMSITIGAAGMALAGLEIGRLRLLRASENRNRALERQPAALRKFWLQDGWFARPLGWAFGQGFLIIRLSDGAWQEILTSPGELLSDGFYLKYPLACRSDDQIVTMGIGGNPNAWKKRVQYDGFKVGARDLVKYTVNPNGWHSADTYTTHSRAPIVTRTR